MACWCQPHLYKILYITTPKFVIKIPEQPYRFDKMLFVVKYIAIKQLINIDFKEMVQRKTHI